MSFRDERPAFEREFDAYYATMPNDVSDIESHLAAIADTNPDWSSWRLKESVYEAISTRCPVKVFRHFPFAYELGVGKIRTNLGEGGVGQFLKFRELGQDLLKTGNEWWGPCQQSGLSVGWHVLDDNHHCLGMDNVFRYGLNGLLDRATERLESAKTDDERAFLHAMQTGLRCQIALSNRFADEAESMLTGESDPVVRERLSRIADVARRVPANPPATFYEGLATVQFMRETTQAMEGNGISILGHIDRMLGPLYDADLANGRITREEAVDLLAFWLAMHDTKFGMTTFGNHVGTNSTVMIGGCDADGTPVFNEVTRMIIEVYREHRNIDPKLNTRISSSHPAEFFDLLSDLAVSGCKSISLFNDDVVIPANVKMGKAERDCRLYAGGGCQENVLENTEVNSRATIYLNLLAVFLEGLIPGKIAFMTERDGVELTNYDGFTSFDQLYSAFLENLRRVLIAHVTFRNIAEGAGPRYNPVPLHSATIDDCIGSARGIMDGGARYSNGSISLTGIGTLIDSLYALREVVYERQIVSLSDLREMLSNDFAGEEAFRQHLVNRVAKFGQDDEGIRAFSAQVFADLARVSRGHANTRGGEYEASLFSFRTFTHMGGATGATPDGRRKGEYLSPGMSPSPLAFTGQTGITDVLRALEPVDLTDYPVVAVLDAKLPTLSADDRTVMNAVMRAFIDYGGSVMQINLVDQSVLLDARAHPERHTDLVVRISGYSAYFTTLPDQVQDEVIERTVLKE
jgi:trans-4-hydroxy-L-proline dehydratase